MHPYQMPQFNWKQALTTVVVLTAGVGAIAFLQLPQLERLKTRGDTLTETEVQRDVAAEWARLAILQQMPSLGYDNLIASTTFLNFLQYFGDIPAREKSDYSLSPEYFEVILRRDPFFREAYTFLSTSTALYAGMPERSIALTSEGLSHLTPTVPVGSFFVWRNKAIDQLLFLGDAAGAQQSFETAADWAIASGLPNSQNAAAVSRQTAQFLAKNPDSKAAQAAAWAMVLTNAPDDRTRRTAIEKIEALGGKIVINPDGSFHLQPPAED
ncbi:MAG TPA: hypothetical protein IGS37_13755 [Synechococcales cyanobacterium M55_K2018_004]|nr:hypothetical protein [Synechococcales cyanobacterium M55_K2018_004]